VVNVRLPRVLGPMERRETRLIQGFGRFVCVGAGCFLLTAGAAEAQTFDGSWSVEVRTERGACEPVYRYYIEVRNGEVRLRSMTGETSPNVAGRIHPSGRIAGQIGAADDPVDIRGRLEDGSGEGTWNATARGCSGRWGAEKRG
jgi:hypothetical protein